MKTRSWMAAAGMAALCLALAACGGSGARQMTETPGSPEDAARADYERIAAGANALLLGDVLGYFGTSDEVERVETRCVFDRCTIGLVRFIGLDGFSVEDSEVTLRGTRGGVRLVEERLDLDDVEFTVLGGWLEHSFFAAQARLVVNAGFPNAGATVVANYAVGNSTGDIPDGPARWEGAMVGRDMRASPGRGQLVEGDAAVTVALGPSGIEAEVAFTGIAGHDTGERWNDMAWRGMAVTKDGFGHRAGPGDTIAGRFFGPDQEEVGGVFERDGIAGAFGAVRQTR